MEMGLRIKQLRKEKGWTQAELASKLGLKDSAIAKYEKGRVENMKRDTIAKMAELFGCSPVYLMCMEDKHGAAATDFPLDSNEQKLLNTYRSFNATGKAKLMDYVADLDSSPRNKEGFQDSSTGEIEKSAKDSLGRFA